MIDTQRLGALLRALIRDEVLEARVRTPAASPVRATSVIGPELPRPDPQSSQGTPPPGARAPVTSQEEVTANPARAVAPLVAGQTPAQPSAVLLLAERVAVPDEGTRATPSRTDNVAAREASPQRPALYAVPGGAGPSAALDLSDTGRMLLSALRMQESLAQGPAPGSAMQPTLRAVGSDASAPAASQAAPARPLVAVPPHSEFATDRLALQLKDAVEFSGVFYESHLAQWADDLRPRALLAHEPQARWPVAAEIAHTATAAAQAPGDYAAPMLRQQLEVLDTGRFVWAGELWPGQRGALVIEEDEPSAHPDPSAAMPRVARWRVRLTLDFAHLGTIDASLLLAGDSLDLALRCDAADVATQMRAAAPTLRAAIAERALDLDHISIADDRAA